MCEKPQAQYSLIVETFNQPKKAKQRVYPIQKEIRHSSSHFKSEPSRESLEEKAKQKNNIQKSIYQATQAHLNSPPQASKKRKKDPEAQQRQALEKTYLPFSSILKLQDLKRIHSLINKYTTEQKGEKHGLALLRFLSRKELVKIFSITIAEIRAKGDQPINSVEKHIMNPALDSYGFVSVLAGNLQSHLFKMLFVDNVKPREQPYQIKMKHLKTQLNDKSNFYLRRGILNRTVSFEFIEKATEQELKSQERKSQQKQIIKRLVRESEVWPESKQTKKEKENEDKMVAEVPQESIQDDEPLLVEMTEEKKALSNSYQSVQAVFEKCRKEIKARIQSIDEPSKKRLLTDYKQTLQQK